MRRTALLSIAAALLSAAPGAAQVTFGHVSHPGPTPTPNPGAPKTFACPATHFRTDIGGLPSSWDAKTIRIDGAQATQRYRAPGAGADVMWCRYMQTSATVPNVSSSIFVVLQAPASHPICAEDTGKMSFTCRGLKPGEHY